MTHRTKRVGRRMNAAEIAFDLADKRKKAREQAGKLRAAERETDKNLEWGIDVDELERQGVDVTASVRGGHAAARRKSGVDWLLDKGRLQQHQLACAIKYGDLYRSANDVSVRSCADDSVRGGDPLPVQMRRRQAQIDLDKIRSLALVGHARLIEACDQIAGEGKTVRSLVQTDAEAVKLETSFCIALDLIAQHYGMIQACKPDSSTSSA